GIGIAFFFLVGLRSGDVAAAYFAARTTAIADMLFTLSAGVVQPLSGLGLILLAGWDPWALWLVATYALYLLALACWLPVVWLQLRMRDMLRAKLAGEPIDEALLQRRFRWWFALGWPAFVGLVAVFWLMVAKPACPCACWYSAATAISAATSAGRSPATRASSWSSPAAILPGQKPLPKRSARTIRRRRRSSTSPIRRRPSRRAGPVW